MEKTSFKTYLSESVNDSGIFKALFMGGLPGSGKSYTISKITDGKIEPRIVNTDKMSEFLAKINKTKLSKDLAPEKLNAILDTSKHLTKNQLVNYINSMLPLLSDGTSTSINNILRRRGQLESVGYDCGMVWVNTSLETAIDRAQKRDRHVDVEFIKHVHELSEENKSFFKSKFEFFLEINNNDGDLTDQVIQEAYKKVKYFYTEAVKNPIGKRNIAKLRHIKNHYLVPELYSKDDIENVVTSWYQTQ